MLKEFAASTSQISGSNLTPPKKLVSLLEFLHIIALIPEAKNSESSTEKEHDIVYLTPCVFFP